MENKIYCENDNLTISPHIEKMTMEELDNYIEELEIKNFGRNISQESQKNSENHAS